MLFLGIVDRLRALSRGAQDPDALATNHDRQVYDELSRAWKEMQVGCPGMLVVLDDNGEHGGIQQA